MKVMHIGYVDEQVLIDLKHGKKIGTYMIHLKKSKYINKHQDSFKKGNVTITWDVG